MKTCTSCKQMKSKDNFYTCKGYLKSLCKICEKLDKAKRYKQNSAAKIAKSLVYQKKNRRARSAYSKKWYLANRYKITQEQYDQLFLKQEGKCAICGKHRDELDRDLCVDHNHITDKVRGLLCYRCNVALGYLKDDVSSLLKAIQYLEATNAPAVG